MSQFYNTYCKENGIEVNTHLLEVLEDAKGTENVTLEATGVRHLECVQRLNDVDLFALCKCLQSALRVTELDLKYNNITDQGALYLAELLQQENPPLRSLDLMFNDILADGGEVISRSLHSNRSLLYLSLSGNKIGNRGGMQVARMLQANNTLQELDVADCDLATQCVIAIIIAVKNSKTIRCVDLSRPLLFSQQEEWAVHCCDMLAVNSSLVELHLGKMGMSDTGMQRITEGLRRNHTLRYLDVRCNRITRDGVRHLANVLMENPSLEVIDLSSNRIENEGTMYLSEAIAKSGSSLKELAINRNNVNTSGLLALSQAIKANTTLTHIYVWGNFMAEPVCKAFKDLLTNGRLLSQNTDLTAYEVDGRVFLAEVNHYLRKRYNRTDGSDTDSNSS
ncbi:leucine-rich repeat-containing protein 34-like [Cynoglossus semilaevis]|uniref:Leucine rich repeat containing 34 n=1 Tax=Cynoglossus semilaevis TaxID=244447 RepID=A0A3P8W701_CYNSE|nr:leucine-rich repeat-containing protein 34-like [Cynoglossus semilaevis]